MIQFISLSSYQAVCLLLSAGAFFHLPAKAGVLAGEQERTSGKESVVPPVSLATERSHFRIGAGAAYRSLGGVNFTTGSRSGNLKLPFLAAALGRRFSQVGSAEEYADRDYRDGFVHQDGGTQGDGSTWNWGYSNGSQQAGDTLTFHGQGNSFTQGSRSRSDTDPGAWGVDGDGAVPVVQLDWEYDLRPQMTLGVSLQYSFLAFDGRNSGQSFSASQEQVSQKLNVTDVYDTTGIIVPMSPYEGSHDGPGPLLENKPLTRGHKPGRVFDRSTVSFYNQIEESLDVQLHHFSIGPTVGTKLGPVALTFGAGLSLNIADWTATHTETLYVKQDGKAERIYQRWSDRASHTNVLPGFYGQFSAHLPLTKYLSFSAFGNYDWSQRLTGQVGPSHFSIDPSGWTVGAMLGAAF